MFKYDSVNIPQMEKSTSFYFSLNCWSDKNILKAKLTNLEGIRDIKFFQMKELGPSDELADTHMYGTKKAYANLRTFHLR